MSLLEHTTHTLINTRTHTYCHGYGEDPKAAQTDRSSGGLCSRRAEQVCNQVGIGETRGRRQKAEVISRRSVRQDSQRQAGSEPGDQAENR